MDMMTNKDATEFIGCSRNKFQTMLRAGKILPAGRKNAKSVLYLKSDIEKLKKEFNKKNPKRALNKTLPEIRQNAITDATKDNALIPSMELNEIGTAVMFSVTDELKQLGLYRDHDKHYIRTYAINNQLYEFFTAKGLESMGVQHGKGGVLMESPFLKIADKYLKACEIMRKNLGLNPLARQKLNPQKKDDIDDMGELFGT